MERLLLSKREAAEALGCSVRTIENMVARIQESIRKCDSSGVYALGAGHQDYARCRSIFVLALAAQSVACDRSRRSIRKRPPRGAACIARTTAE